MSVVVYLNGQYLPIEEAKISVLDRGFIFGDGVYEVIPVCKGHIFELQSHMVRLNNSLDKTFIDRPYGLSQWQKILQELIARNGKSNIEALYIQVTRGVSEREFSIDICKEQTIFAMPKLSAVKRYHSEGIAAILTEDIRWRHCNIKAITLLPNVLLRYQAKQAGAQEAILLRGGYVTEGAASNVFICKNGVISTPAEGSKLLSGITRSILLRLLSKSGILFKETPMITEADIRNADEIWLTSSTWDVAPVTRLDSKPVGLGRPGELWQKVSEIYRTYKAEQTNL